MRINIISKRTITLIIVLIYIFVALLLEDFLSANLLSFLLTPSAQVRKTLYEKEKRVTISYD